jgi:hypothetical protein
MTRFARPAHLALCALAAAALPAFTGCGSGDTDPAQVAPASTPAFAELVVDPEGSQETAVRALMAKFPGGIGAADDPEASGGLMSGLIEQALTLSGAPIDYATDIQPWLGERAAIYVTGVKADSLEENPDVAVALSSTDAGASRATLEKLFPGGRTATHEGVTYNVGPPDGDETVAVGMIDNFVVIGSPGAFTASVDASKGESLGDAQPYQDAIGALPPERLAAFYFDPASLIELSGQAAGDLGADIAAEQAALAQTGPLAGAVTADSNGIVIDSATKAIEGMTLPTGSADVLGQLPGDSSIAAGVPAFGPTLKTQLDQAATTSGFNAETLNLFLTSQTGLDALSILDWLGDTGLFVAGTSLENVNGGVVIESNDPDASQETLESLEGLLGDADGLTVGKPLVEGDAGFSIESKDLPEPIVVEQSGSKVVIAYGAESAEQALAGGQTLADNPVYTAAAGRLGDGFEPSLYIGLDSILEIVAGGFELDKDPVFAGVQAYLEPLSDIVAGGRVDGDQILSRMRIDIE